MSLPTRERELKPLAITNATILSPSLPTRERELKLFEKVVVGIVCASLPTRERELKPACHVVRVARLQVAPHAGARIETSPIFPKKRTPASLPTRERELKPLDLLRGVCDALSLPTRERELKLGHCPFLEEKNESLPTRERELKRGGKKDRAVYRKVAPHAGARIETASASVRSGRR